MKLIVWVVPWAFTVLRVLLIPSSARAPPIALKGRSFIKHAKVDISVMKKQIIKKSYVLITSIALVDQRDRFLAQEE